MRAAGADTRPATLLLGLEGAQAVVGFVQYFAGLPVAVVMLHMLGAALVAAAATWLLISVREPDGAETMDDGWPAPPWTGQPSYPLRRPGRRFGCVRPVSG